MPQLLAALVVLLYGWLPELHQLGHRFAEAAGAVAACARTPAEPTPPEGGVTMGHEPGGCGFCAMPRAGQQSVSGLGTAFTWSELVQVAEVVRPSRTAHAAPFVLLQLARGPPVLLS
ncbi:MAG TPA: hypothetical protein VK348_09110 [Planctomycetota bacterium]|nr:hypothetical protein [Planctomycetota bacterium]